MSWKALDWATESDIGSPTTKFVLHLLANKADEDFRATPRSAHSWPNPVPGEAQSCERLRNWKPTASSHAGRSSTIPEHSDPPATTSTTPKHPISHPVPTWDPPVPNRDPLNPPFEPPTEPAADAARVLAALPEAWRVGRQEAEILIPAIEAAL